MVMGAFLSTAGTSPLYARHAVTIINCMVTVDAQIDVPGFGEERFEQNGWTYPTAPRFEWAMKYCDLWLVETSTNTGFLMAPWRR
jgi:hypothetical protein